MPGFHAFPGGSVDRHEAPVEGGPAGEPPTAVGAAIRELHEETGVRVAPSALTPAGHWITPPFSPIRFDTRFYLAALPGGEEARVDPGELESGEWIEPQSALARWERGTVLAAPPVVHLLRVAASSNDPSVWPAAATSIEEARGGEVRLVEMRRGVILVPLRTPTLPPATHTNCYIVGSNRPAIVDPGASDPGEASALDGVLASLEGRVPSRILLTHHHHDHVRGALALARRLGIPITATRETRDAIAPAIPVDEIVVDGARFDTGDGAPPFVALETPGHARGHLCFTAGDALLSGDLILGMGTTVIDPPDGDMGDYMDSLARLATLPVTTLFPGHGPVLADSLSKIREYQAHRLEREQQVLAALADGLSSPESIVPRVYAEVPVEMHPFAARSVLAHLEWLERKGAARRTGSAWSRA